MKRGAKSLTEDHHKLEEDASQLVKRTRKEQDTRASSLQESSEATGPKSINSEAKTPITASTLDAPKLSPLYCPETFDPSPFEIDDEEQLNAESKNKPTPLSPMSKALQKAAKHNIAVPKNVREMYEPEDILKHIQPILEWRRKSKKTNVPASEEGAKKTISPKRIMHNGKRARSKSFSNGKLGL